MTQQYLVGELSLILGELEAAATNDALGREVARLRRDAETTRPAALGPVVVQAVKLSNLVCWDALTRGGSAAFIRDTGIHAELWEFGVCAGFLAERQTGNDIGRS